MDPETDEFGLARSFVSLPDPTQSATPQSQKDVALWEAMDRASDEVAKVFANGSDFEIFTSNGPVKVPANSDLRPVFPYTPGRRDGIGTTHHETGTLRMGSDASTSVTNSDARLHAVANTYIAGPALFPVMGSPNPMLTGVATYRGRAQKLT